MKVYLVEVGCYNDRYIGGIYATPEAAMVAHPIPEDYSYPETPSAMNCSRRGGWIKDGSRWDNGLDWNDGKSIQEYEVEGLHG